MRAPMTKEFALELVSADIGLSLDEKGELVARTEDDRDKLAAHRSVFPYSDTYHTCPSCGLRPAGGEIHMRRQQMGTFFSPGNKTCRTCIAAKQERRRQRTLVEREAEGLPAPRRRRTKAEMEAARAALSAPLPDDIGERLDTIRALVTTNQLGNDERAADQQETIDRLSEQTKELDRANLALGKEVLALQEQIRTVPEQNAASPDLSAILARLDAQDARIAELERSNDDKSKRIEELKALVETRPAAATPPPTPNPTSPLAIRETTNVERQLEDLADQIRAIAENAGDRLEWLEEKVLSEPGVPGEEPTMASVEKPLKEEEDEEPGGSAAVQEEWAQARAQTKREFAEFEEARRAYRIAHGLD
jgi:uncharacterized coiled-coil protein SlyX